MTSRLWLYYFFLALIFGVVSVLVVLPLLDILFAPEVNLVGALVAALGVDSYFQLIGPISRLVL